MIRPLIGLTTAQRPEPGGATSFVGMRETYIAAIADAGGLPVLVPPGADATLRSTFERLDGLLLPGGVDIDPDRFGESPHARLETVETARDELELVLCRWALGEEKPLLGICRGIQVMNVAAGGTLWQDIPAQRPSPIDHRPINRGLPRDHIAHEAIVEPGTLLARAVGSGPLPVNSWHHQAINAAGRGLVVTALAPDGVIEGVEMPGHRFALGVQFHPEDLYQGNERLRSLFVAFVAACAPR